MRARISALLGFCCLVFLMSCGQNETSRDNIPPAAPRIVQRSPEDAYAQRGIRPEPAITDDQYRVRIEWYPNTEPDVVGYHIWRRREDQDSLSWQIIRDLRYGTNLDRGPVLVFIDAGDDYTGFPADLLRPDQPDDTMSTRGYKWWIEAYDDAGNRSPLSESLYYRMINNPRSMRVDRQVNGEYALRWQFTANNDADDLSYYYMLRVYQQAGGPDSLMWWQRVNRYADDTYVILDNDHSARPFQNGQAYIWQLNVVVMRTDTSSRVPAGSAAYTSFVYQN